jgi:hypothetical protein
MTVGLVLVAVSAVLAGQQMNPHIGHVMTGFGDTPEKQGLLPTALAEAKIAAQHAGLAARTPEDLDAMKLHVGHVLHAVDPSVEASGPGQGYGVKRAAQGVAQHVGLAAGTEGASANIKTHATHVTASAETVVARADEIVALGQKIRAASTAADAAPLVAQLNTLAGQLVTGVDANGDGTIGWQKGEGGLQHVQQHMDLMIKGEGGGLGG